MFENWASHVEGGLQSITCFTLLINVISNLFYVCGNVHGCTIYLLFMLVLSTCLSSSWRTYLAFSSHHVQYLSKALLLAMRPMQHTCWLCRFLQESLITLTCIHDLVWIESFRWNQAETLRDVEEFTSGRPASFHVASSFRGRGVCARQPKLSLN